MIQLVVEGYNSKNLPFVADILSKLKPQLSGEIAAKVQPSSELRRLNLEYAGKDQATDVLSFSYIEQGQQTSCLGDVVISRDHIRSQAEASGTTEETEFILLLLHGCLHVLGFDHSEVKDRREMDQLQADTMAQLGLAYRDFGWVNSDMVS